MARVELIYMPGCPNIEAARACLLHAFQMAGIRPSWQEWVLQRPETPAHTHGHGSPTILIDGQDVTGEPPLGSDNSCRLYAASSGNCGIPPLEMVVAALQRATNARISNGHPVANRNQSS